MILLKRFLCWFYVKQTRTFLAKALLFSLFTDAKRRDQHISLTYCHCFKKEEVWNEKKVFSYEKKSVNIIYILLLSSAQINACNIFLFHLPSVYKNLQVETKQWQIIFDLVSWDQSRQVCSAKHENGSGVCNVTLTWTDLLGSWLSSQTVFWHSHLSG